MRRKTMPVNSISSLSQAFKAMPTQVNAEKSNLTQKTEKSPYTNSTENFSEIMNKALETVDLANKNAISKSETLLTGESQQLHSVVLAAEKADIALQMTMQIRNKALDAYQEIMRMQI